MLFNSTEFAFFLPIVLLGIFTLPEKGRIAFLLAASYFFYGFAKPEYILLLILNTAVAYICSCAIESSTNPQVRKNYLVFNIVVSCGVLFVFKYFNFFVLEAKELLAAFHIATSSATLQLVMPIGISFYTFQTLGYTIDVYRRELPAERSFWRLALFVAFFPHLVAGPILRAPQLLPQIVQRHRFDTRRLASGAPLVLLGLIKKVVIADRLAIFVDAVYANPSQHHGLVLLLAAYFFAIQIYCDFSGYSDIAVGVARIMGIDLNENFRRPYLSTSPREFWRRWHISLSTWIRDYLYLPLGGNRCSAQRWAFNILLVFALSGLWHGANYTFIVWGLYHGLLLLLDHWLTPHLQRLRARLGLSNDSLLVKALALMLMFHLACLGWVFFRANSIADAWLMLGNMFVFANEGIVFDGGLPKHQILLCIVSIAALLIAEMAFEKLPQAKARLEKLPWPVQWALFYAGFFLFLLFPGADESRQFIYFQF